ncbi:MAG: dihydrofolate reductase [Bacteroidales bacterium]|nr:dihydrofolate reductase [Bacteroidales bacterium]
MEPFKVLTEQFADIRILRYRVPGFDNLPLQSRELLYYLHEAALWGRDIIYDQNYKHNLLIRHMLENMYLTYRGDRGGENWQHFEVYLKRVWFSNGIHHHYSMDKFFPELPEENFREMMRHSDASGFAAEDGKLEGFINKIIRLLYHPDIDAKRLVQDDGVDMVALSANNFYENVTQQEAEDFYNAMNQANDPEAPQYGLNSKLIKKDGRLQELVWKKDGMYGSAISKIIFYLRKALAVADNEKQKVALEKLIEFYTTGDLKTFDAYSIAWLQDADPLVDVVNGFIEVYGDAVGRKASWESVVSVRDAEATRRAAAISVNAQWFEDHSPVQPEYKKEKVQGVSARGINAVVLAGDCSPSTPIGINLPNADWIRARYGSKSVTISNIIAAYDEASKESGAIEAFAWSQQEIALAKKYGNLAANLHVDLHEIVGHGSGRIKEGVANPGDTLKNSASTIEEARADLFALYFATDAKLIALGLMPEKATGEAGYNSYIRGGLLTQLVRVAPGKNLEESHMRNRQLIALWAYEHGKAENVIERKTRDGRTFFVINNYEKLRALFGQLLREVQRIKSEGDYQAARQLIESYGVKVDPALHQEVLKRWETLGIAPFSGFINPQLEALTDADGTITDVRISYPDDFAQQMLHYSRHYAALPVK